MPRHSSFRPAFAVFTAALAGALIVQPAAAQPSVGAPYAHNHWQGPGPDAPPVPVDNPTALPVAAPGGTPAADEIAGRNAWLAECRRRLSARDEWKHEWERDGRRDRGQGVAGPDQCESYLDDYYAHARAAHAQHMRAYSGQSPHMVPGRAMSANGTGSGCCCEREVIETIEEVTPARRVIPRRAPPRDKRIRIAPDKRVRTQ